MCHLKPLSPLFFWLRLWKLIATDRRGQRESKIPESYICPCSLEITQKLFVITKKKWLVWSLYPAGFSLKMKLQQTFWKSCLCKNSWLWAPESLSHKHAFQFPGLQSLVRHRNSSISSPPLLFFSSSHHTPNSKSLRISLLLTHPTVLQVSILQETKPPRVSVKRLSRAIYKQEKRKGNVPQVRESSESGSALWFIHLSRHTSTKEPWPSM